MQQKFTNRCRLSTEKADTLLWFSKTLRKRTEMKKLVLFLPVALALMLLSCMNRHDNIPQQKISEWEATKGKNKVSKMVAHDSIDEALRLIIELEPMRTDDPQIPFMKGVIWHKLGKTDSATQAFQRSAFIYDSLLAIRPNINDAINRASCILILQGDDAYQHQLDSIENTLEGRDKEVIQHLFRDLTDSIILSCLDRDTHDAWEP